MNKNLRNVTLACDSDELAVLGVFHLNLTIAFLTGAMIFAFLV
jgi:hypothetical protein